MNDYSIWVVFSTGLDDFVKNESLDGCFGHPSSMVKLVWEFLRQIFCMGLECISLFIFNVWFSFIIEASYNGVYILWLLFIVVLMHVRA